MQTFSRDLGGTPSGLRPLFSKNPTCSAWCFEPWGTCSNSVPGSWLRWATPWRDCAFLRKVSWMGQDGRRSYGKEIHRFWDKLTLPEITIDSKTLKPTAELQKLSKAMWFVWIVRAPCQIFVYCISMSPVANVRGEFATYPGNVDELVDAMTPEMERLVGSQISEFLLLGSMMRSTRRHMMMQLQ